MLTGAETSHSVYVPGFVKLYLDRLAYEAVDKTGRGAGVGDQWLKSGDWELGDHVIHL